MPFFDSCDPRTMFPPPITRPTLTPMSATSLISSQNRFTRSESRTSPLWPASASPDSLSRMREYATAVAVTGALLLAHLEACETANCQRRSRRLAGLLDELTDRLGVVTHPRLIEQRVLGVEPVDLTLDDLTEHRFGLACRSRLLLVDAALAVDDVGLDLLPVDAERHLRNACGNVLRDGLRHGEHGITAATNDVDQDRDPAVVVHV